MADDTDGDPGVGKSTIGTELDIAFWRNEASIRLQRANDAVIELNKSRELHAATTAALTTQRMYLIGSASTGWSGAMPVTTLMPAQIWKPTSMHSMTDR